MQIVHEVENQIYQVREEQEADKKGVIQELETLKAEERRINQLADEQDREHTKITRMWQREAEDKIGLIKKLTDLS